MAQLRREAQARRHRLRANLQGTVDSGLFDADWYVKRSAHARASDLLPFDHYLAHGVRRLADPGPMFDVSDYLRQAWHLRPGIDDPLSHYLRHGQAAGLRPRSVCEPEPGGWPDRQSLAVALLPDPVTPQRLAVMVHAFHVELFDEICERLALLPCRFSALVSTDTPEKAAAIEAAIAAHRLDAQALVRIVPNRGRNFGPLLLSFRDIIAEHDLLLHLHTKKSSYRGSAQDHWRRSLLRSLLPARAAISALLARFADDPGLGVISADAGEAQRYWAYGWLSSRAAGADLHRRLGLRGPMPDGMFDYPLGGMFWARTRALSKLLGHPWNIDDFPEEAGQTDGTIAHAIERSIIAVAYDAGYGFDEIDYQRGMIRHGWGSRNLTQYLRASHGGLLASIDWAGTVSFDLFDTLLTRTCLSPDTVHGFIGFVVARNHPEATDYVERRHQAEVAARRNSGAGDVDLEQIHAEFVAAAASCWSLKAIDFVLRTELALDARTLVPRRIMVEALRHARASGRRTILVSDSYLTRPQLDTLLHRHGLMNSFDAVYLSSQQRARKDAGSMWQLVGASEDAGRLLHVGDNAQSDIQRTADAGIAHFHVLAPPDLFELRRLLPPIELGRTRPLGDRILFGPLAAELCNSPYLDAPFGTPLQLADAQTAGMVLLGPLLFAFVGWIVSHPTIPHLRTLCFVAREGWFLKRLYDAVVAATGRTDLPRSVYFECSRRAALAARQGAGLDVDAVLRGAGFRGSLQEFCKARLGFVPNASLGHARHRIELPRDVELVRCMLSMMQDDIVAKGRDAARALTAYADAHCIIAPGPHGFVDVGYSGTMQTALQQVLGLPLIGLYMGVSHDAAQVRAGGGQAFGAFADGDVGGFTGGYGLMLEAFLTAPHGQVIGHDDSVSPPRPLHRHDGVSQRNFAVLDRCYDGAERYALSLLACWGPEVLSMPFRPQAATAMLEAVRLGRIVLDPALRGALSVEDDFCGSGEIPVFG